LTELQKMYAASRIGGKIGHHGALRAIARKTGIDEATIDRCLKRARRTDVLEEKRAKQGAKAPVAA
jgi:IS30 family transposase